MACSVLFWASHRVSSSVFRPAKCFFHFSTLLSSEFLDFTDFKATHGLLPGSESLKIFPNFLTVNEHELLLKCAEERIQRLCRRPKSKSTRVYEESHYDSVISGYRECSVSTWNTPATPASSSEELKLLNILNAAKSMAPDVGAWLPPHCLELADPTVCASEIRPHVDNLNASGSVIMGICLESPTIIVFKHINDEKRVFKALLPERCLYIQRDSLRFNYTHEIPLIQTFRGNEVNRRKRIVILLRDELADFRSRSKN
ncbi:Alpha-ketoglutarate-dependent dioxygenase alkB 7, mitochondrial [Nowakowskiella sp. JEL0078]|nr:Alpha-ketoglutarate-dependent dioxygenase alkB 7, mitochondrial [Nowakowskiella sp. JEL0078]